ncbi:hypothetical protein SFRURICE_005110 [Spodoptera frugiperda]|nr:hypothetical protein SFRURICE_005110 [Spodoptera frugiperda]
MSSGRTRRHSQGTVCGTEGTLTCGHRRTHTPANKLGIKPDGPSTFGREFITAKYWDQPNFDAPSSCGNISPSPPLHRDEWGTIRAPPCSIAKDLASKIAEDMTLKKFQSIRRYIHLNDNLKDDGDRYYIIRLLVEKVRHNCASNIPEGKRFSIDEMMVPYKGTRAGIRKQYFFVRASPSGLVHDFIIYGGEDTFTLHTFTEKENGLGAKVVITLAKSINEKPCSVLYFNNFFTSIELIHHLRNEYGTVRANRHRGAEKKKLPSDKELKKRKAPRLCASLKWFDNKFVVAASTYVDAHPVQHIIRYKREERFIYKRKPQQVSPLHYNLLLQCPTHRTDFLHSSFFIQSILLWNALPTDREERGSSDYRMSDDVFVCRWNDNDVVTVAINFENWALTTVTRWSNEKKRKNFNPQPSVIASYNMHMGGVDKCDQLVPNLRTRMRIRKWWWPIFAYFLDVSVVNGWVLSRKNGCNKETARSLLASHGTSPHQGQKPAKPLSTTRYDGKDHWIVPISTERRCANQC